MKRPPSGSFRMRIRVYARKHMLGPGKMELLQHVLELGSLSAAAGKMRMSYMRAWTLVKELNRRSGPPMVILSRGGSSGGTARLTPFGKRVLALYQRMETESTRAAKPFGQRLVRLLEKR